MESIGLTVLERLKCLFNRRMANISTSLSKVYHPLIVRTMYRDESGLSLHASTKHMYQDGSCSGGFLRCPQLCIMNLGVRSQNHVTH